MDTWWLKFSLGLSLAKILRRVPLVNQLSLIKNFKHAHALIKGEIDWLARVTAPSTIVFEDLDYLLQSPITIDEIIFEKKYPLELKPHLKRFLDTLSLLGYVSKNNDTYSLRRPITLEFTSEFQEFMKDELNDTPSGSEQVLLAVTASLLITTKGMRNLAVRRLRYVPSLYAFSNYILPLLNGLAPQSIVFAGGYVRLLIPLLNHFSSANFTYFEHNSLVWSKLLKLVKSVSSKNLSRLKIVEENIFADELQLPIKHANDLVYLSFTYPLETSLSMNTLVKNIANLLSQDGVFVCDDFILFSTQNNPYLFASEEAPYYYHYLYLKQLTKALKNAGFKKIKYLFPCKKTGLYRGCIAKK